MKKKRLRYLILLAAILFISIGFAVISTNLSINGLFNFTNNSWSITLKNIVVDDNSVTKTTPTINDDEDTITFSAELNKPGDYYSFNVDVLNESTLDAMLGSITVDGITSQYSDYLSCVVTYSNGVTPNPNDILYKTARITLNVKLLYKDIETSQIPENILSPTITITVNYRQANNNAVFVTNTNHWNFDYTGDVQTFTPMKNGTYKIELWGAGNINGFNAGNGAYVSGNIDLNTNDIYVYVGSGASRSRDRDLFNGSFTGEYSGGGATDIRTTNGDWNAFNSLKSRIIVAGAGGGGDYDGNMIQSPGHGGGLVGYSSITNSESFSSYTGKGATQISGGACATQKASNIQGYPENWQEVGTGKFGMPGYGGGARSSNGGSGYFGGGHGAHTGSNFAGGGGGSSFISGHAGCVAIAESSTESNIVFKTDSSEVACNSETSATYNSLGYNTDPKCSIHYSTKVFTDTVMIDGMGYRWTTVKEATPSGMPNKNGMGTVTGNSGNGFAKITLIN